jgi:diamine N-acetyltransferase
MKLIRAAEVNDLHVVHELAYKIWPSAYGDILSASQMEFMLKKIYSPGSLHNQLNVLHHNFIIAYDKNVPIGFASFSAKETDSTIFHLHKIYVLPQQQGNGIGKYLLDYVIDACISSGAHALQLNVHRHNKARYFYEKHGFTVKEEIDIPIGEGFFMNDYIMEKVFS